MQKGQAQSINLAKNRGDSFVDEFIAWALNAGRVIVIFTELIALCAFLYRFSLDNTLVDLHDHITQEQSVLNLLKSNENQYRNLQSRLQTIKTASAESSQTLQTFNNISSLIPQDLSVTTFNVTANTIHIAGTTSSIADLKTFIDKLKTYPMVNNVSLDQVQTDTATATIEVDISVVLN